MNWVILIVAGLSEVAFAACLGKAKVAVGNEVFGWYDLGLSSLKGSQKWPSNWKPYRLLDHTCIFHGPLGEITNRAALFTLQFGLKSNPGSHLFFFLAETKGQFIPLPPPNPFPLHNHS